MQVRSKLALSAIDSLCEIIGQNLIAVNQPYLSEFLDFKKRKKLILKLSSRRTSLFSYKLGHELKKISTLF